MLLSDETASSGMVRVRVRHESEVIASDKGHAPPKFSKQEVQIQEQIYKPPQI